MSMMLVAPLLPVLAMLLLLGCERLERGLDDR